MHNMKGNASEVGFGCMCVCVIFVHNDQHKTAILALSS